MSDAETTSETPVDPKEAMRRALEHKKNASHATEAAAGDDRVHGGPHKQVGGKRTFRRKSGG